MIGARVAVRVEVQIRGWVSVVMRPEDAAALAAQVERGLVRLDEVPGLKRSDLVGLPGYVVQVGTPPHRGAP